MKNPEKRFHGLFLLITFIWLITVTFYQVFSDRRRASLKNLRFKPPQLNDPQLVADERQIKVNCDSICYFLADGKRIRSRTDSDAGGGLPAVKLRFYDAYRGLIGYEDDKPHPNFFVIDTQGEFLQVARMKLDNLSFNFEAYYPSSQLIEFRASDGKRYLYSANKPELFIL